MTLHPWVRFLPAGEASKERLLKRALESARGEIIAVTEPYCFFPQDWLRKLRRSHCSSYPVIGGAVEYGGRDTLSGWACHFADYGPFLLPAKSRVTRLLAGNHISYKRGALDHAATAWQDEYAKVFVLWELERQGVPFLFDSELRIWSAPATDFAAFARRYYRNAREFAARRAEGLSPLARGFRILTTPALPAVLFYRRIQAVWGKANHRYRLIQAAPLLAILVVFWSAGEFSGYVQAGLARR
jgi:hypothetical protein